MHVMFFTTGTRRAGSFGARQQRPLGARGRAGDAPVAGDGLDGAPGDETDDRGGNRRGPGHPGAHWHGAG